jgi:vitamin K-dependent gamma-carboxylase
MAQKLSIIRLLDLPRNNAQLILWRFFFGMVMFFETAGALAIGYVDDVFKAPPLFTFTFIGFEFLNHLPLPVIYGIYAAMALASLGIAFGYRYRLSALILLLGWCSTYFAHKCYYNNHHYLMLLLILVLFVLPANTRLALDVKQGRMPFKHTCKNWHIWMFIALLWIVYTYASVAKIYPDWIQGEPIRHWFRAKKSIPLLGPFYAWEYTPVIFAWGGILFDLLVVPLLLFKPTRNLAFFVGIGFHLANSITFQIGTFPYMMIASGVFFYPPEKLENIFLKREKKPPYSDPVSQPTSKWLLTGLAVFFLLQIGLPLRHCAFPGPVLWTEEGHKLSWRMMLRSKTGSIHFRIKDEASEKETLHFPSAKELSRAQLRALPSHPDLIYLYVQYLKTLYPNQPIFAVSKKSINYRPRRPFIDPTVDLSTIEWKRFQSADWILDQPARLSFWQKEYPE